jgi:exodeoxyribonuclease V gamma subunit
MIRLHYSNRLENLIAPLAEAVATHQRHDPLERVSIVVPNRVVEQFVRYRLAESIGIAANLKFPFLHSYLAELLESTDKNLKILEADELQLILFECLRRTNHRDDPGLKPARDYILGGSKTDADVELRTLLLAAQLARLFREYSISRRRMIGRWRAARRSDVAAMSETERWQRHLWQLIFDSHGRVREEWLRDRETRLMMLPDAFEATDDLQLEAVLPHVLHMFSSSYAGNAYADIFARLGTLGDVRIYALNPCREFWEDVDTSRRSAFSGWAHRHDKVGEKIAESEDPFSLNESSDPPALRLWGRPGREYIRLLNEVSQCDFGPIFSDPVSSETPTVLEELQQSILDRAPQPSNIEDGKGRPMEPRISFVACPGIRREAEIVANEIWSIVRSNEKLAGEGKAERIRFHEIAVLIPDSAVDDYVAQIDSVFRKQHRLPIDLVSRTITGASRVAEAVDLLLQLPRGRFSRTEIIRLLTHPAMNNQSKSGIDVAKWRRWSEALGIFFGADDYDLKDTYIPRGLFHWDQAIKRLALGTMMIGPRAGSPAFYAAGATGPSYIPCEVAQDELETAARFIRMARSLIADAISIRDAYLTPPDWSLMLGQFVNAYIRPEGALDEQVRDRFLEAIEAIAESELNVGPMSYESAREVVAARVTDLESRRGQYTGRGIAIGSFTSLRSIPFKVIFALGLNDAVFPERDRSEPLDLRTLTRAAGDVSPAERDRYLFLETILAARERIFFSYIARNAKTGDALEPSPVIRELQSILRGFIDEKTLAKLTAQHPISLYDMKYFPEFNGSTSSECEPEFASFDPDARRGARMLALRKKIGAAAPDWTRREGDRLLDSVGAKLRERTKEDLQFPKFESTPAATNPAPEEELALPIAAIRRYLECPLQGAARYSLGMLEDEDAPEDAEDEPVEQSRLNRAVMLRKVFWRAGGKPDVIDAEYAREVRIAQAHGHASAGQFAEAAKAADDSALRQWLVQASEAGVNDFDGWKDIRIGRADEFADAAEILPPIYLDADVHRHDGTTVTRRVSLYGTIRGVSAEAGAAINCVLRKSIKPKDFLPAFLNAIVLAATGAELPEKFRAIVIRANSEKSAEWIREFKPLEQNSALAYLTAVVGDLLSTGNDYFLPIEAVEDVVKELHKPEDRRDLIEAVERTLLNNPPTCSSDYGPVRNPRDFDPPGEEEIEKIVARRFDPIIRVFGK